MTTERRWDSGSRRLTIRRSGRSARSGADTTRKKETCYVLRIPPWSLGLALGGEGDKRYCRSCCTARACRSLPLSTSSQHNEHDLRLTTTRLERKRCCKTASATGCMRPCVCVSGGDGGREREGKGREEKGRIPVHNNGRHEHR